MYLNRWARRSLLLVVLVVIWSLTIVACAGKKPAVINTLPSPDSSSPAEPRDDEDSGPKLEPGQTINPITGKVVEQHQLQRRMILVSIDNLAAARPQAGLSQADLIYEVPAEAGITRYLALFWAGEADKIGPVRSARHYFLDLVLEWNAAWLHVGGSPQHEAALKRLDVVDIDDLKGGTSSGVFWRSADRKRPHNLYTSSDRVRQKLKDRGWETQPPRREPWVFAVPATGLTGAPASRVTMKWPGRRQQAVFTYDPDTMTYTKYDGSTPVIDQLTGEAIPIANIIVQHVSSQRIPGDQEGRLDVKLVGEGDIQIISGGTMRPGRWRKADQSAPTIFTEASGSAPILLPGQTWIIITPNSVDIEFE